jgi:hypothetical protein
MADIGLNVPRCLPQVGEVERALRVAFTSASRSIFSTITPSARLPASSSFPLRESRRLLLGEDAPALAPDCSLESCSPVAGASKLALRLGLLDTGGVTVMRGDEGGDGDDC